jgi:hypothetical protein
METKIDEIARDIYRLSTWIADVAPPAGFTFNQFVVRGEQPFLYHTGMRQLYPLVSGAVDRVVGRQNLRWISFDHVEADECGAMNQFLAAAPDARVVHGEVACAVSLNDLADRPPRAMGDEVLDLGGKDALHPHAPRAAQLGERSLVRGDHTHAPRRRHHVDRRRRTRDHQRRPGRGRERVRGRVPQHVDGTGPHPHPAPPRRPRARHPGRDAGSSYTGDGAHQLRSLADSFDERLAAVLV